MTELALPPRRVALVGNPNCGKTALFNALTGGRQKVANYAGVTVERKEGHATTPEGRRISILDLPGTYSLRARSPDEVVTRDAVLGQLAGETPPDVIVCVADATNLRLVLRLILELKQVGRPLVLALNMFDIAQRQGLRIDIDGLSREIGAPIVTTVATRGRGVDHLLAEVDRVVGALEPAHASVWHEPSAEQIRFAHRDAQRIMKAYVRPPEHPDTLTGKVDAVLLHPVWGLAILFALLFVMFQAVFTGAAPIMDLIESGVGALGGAIGAALPEGWVRDLITDGVIAGVGSVLVFLPQILILFLFIIMLEDFGYMARAAFLMDKIMGGAGLHGRAFIPLLSSFACAIPGIMATRVIDSRRDRLTTILVAPLMTCSARIPVYTLIIGAFIPNRAVWGVLSLQGLVMFGPLCGGDRQRPGGVLRHPPHLLAGDGGAVHDGVADLQAAGRRQRGAQSLAPGGDLPAAGRPDHPAADGRGLVPVDLPRAPVGAAGPAIDYSFAGMIGHALEPFFAPIGFNWQMVVALVPGMAAREVAVAALGTVYAVADVDNAPGVLGATLAHSWSLATGLSFLAWYIFAPQCVATLGVIKRETNSWGWMTFSFTYMMALAYAASFVTYHTAVALGGG